MLNARRLHGDVLPVLHIDEDLDLPGSVFSDSMLQQLQVIAGLERVERRRR